MILFIYLDRPFLGTFVPDITIFRGASDSTFSPELVLNSSVFIRCNRMPVGQWLRNGIVTADGSPNLTSVSGSGIYQCVGSVPGQPETDITGQLGSTFYLLTLSKCGERDAGRSYMYIC